MGGQYLIGTQLAQQIAILTQMPQAISIDDGGGAGALEKSTQWAVVCASLPMPQPMTQLLGCVVAISFSMADWFQ